MLKKLKVAQNKCIRFCLQTGNRKHVGYAEYERIDWLHPERRHHQSVCALVHNFFENKCPAYMSDMFHPKSIKVQTRNSTLQLAKPSSKASGHKGIAYLAPSIWNELPSDVKFIPNLNTSKNKLKKWFLENLKKEQQNIYTN